MKSLIPLVTIWVSLLLCTQFAAAQIQTYDAPQDPHYTAEAVYEVGPVMNTNRHNHHAIVLPDGTVALIGGRTTGFTSLNTAEIFDPETQEFTTHSMKFTHDFTTVVKMNDGRYMLAGGASNMGVPNFAHTEIFDPVSLEFTETGNMVLFRASGGGTALPDGRVVIASAWWTHNNAHTYGELYDPETGTFSQIGPFHISRSHGTVITTADGKAMLLGGRRPTGSREVLPVELYDPDTDEISIVQDYLLVEDEAWTFSINNTVTASQQLANGNYLWIADNQVGELTSYKLITADVETMEISEMETTPPLPDSDSFWFINQPVIDLEHNRAYLIARVRDLTDYYVAVFTVDLEEGTLTESSNYHALEGYELRSAPAVLLPDGRLFVSGGSVSDNFNAVNNTLFITPPQPVATSVEAPDEVPAAIMLHQNYPNPFNPVTQITFGLDHHTNVKLDVYDITGRHIRTLTDNPYPAGTHTVPFDATALSSGIYIYRLSAGHTILTRKMMLVK